MQTRKSNNKTWFKLDNAAKIFPGQNSKTWSNMIRISVNLKEEVDPETLRRAVLSCLPRFPSLDVRIRKGFFWYYFEKNDKNPPIKPDVNNPCVRIRFNENNRFLFRVFYYQNRISLELFHALTDGYGSAVFLSTLTAEYLRLKGHDIPSGKMVLDLNEPPRPEELEDSFAKYATSKVKAKRPPLPTYHRTGTKMPKHLSIMTSGYMPVDILKSKAKEHGVTITEYLASVLMLVHMQLQKDENIRQKEVSIQIPVNCRNQFPSETLRNFSVCYSVRLDPNLGEYTFEEILRQVSLYLRYTNNKKHLQSMFAANLGLEKNPIMRLIPLVIKDLGIGISFALTAEHTTTSLFTNLGIVSLPEEMKPFVDSFILMPSPGKVNGGRVGAVSYGNTMTVTFANLYTNTDIEREFFRFLIRQGIPVRIESNKDV